MNDTQSPLHTNTPATFFDFLKAAFDHKSLYKHQEYLDIQQQRWDTSVDMLYREQTRKPPYHLDT